MLTEELLVSQHTKPGLSNISLSLYKNFYVDILMKRAFKYTFEDDSRIDVYFWQYGLYHLLGIQHIDYKNVTKENFFDKINDGLSFDSFKSDKKTKHRFRDMSDRIELFSCVYHTLKFARVFRVPSSSVKGTANVKVDYLLYQEIENRGLNLGLKIINGTMAPITILIDRENHKGRHIDWNYEKIVKQLEIIDTKSNIIIETLIYSDSFIVSH